MIRWNALISDLSGFATVSRVIIGRLDKDAGIELQSMVRNRNRTDQNDPMRYELLYEGSVRSQMQLAARTDVTVRMHWPPNFNPPATGKPSVGVWPYSRGVG